MALEWMDSLDGVDWQALSALYRLTPMGEKAAVDLATAFGNSRFCCFVYDDGRLIGAGRVLADGVDCSYICDVVVHPDCQGQGIGKAIVTQMVERSSGHRKILLYTFPGREGFYRQLGFRPMRTALALFADPAQAQLKGLIDAE